MAAGRGIKGLKADLIKQKLSVDDRFARILARQEGIEVPEVDPLVKIEKFMKIFESDAYLELEEQDKAEALAMRIEIEGGYYQSDILQRIHSALYDAEDLDDSLLALESITASDIFKKVEEADKTYNRDFANKYQEMIDIALASKLQESVNNKLAQIDDIEDPEEKLDRLQSLQASKEYQNLKRIMDKGFTIKIPAILQEANQITQAINIDDLERSIETKADRIKVQLRDNYSENIREKVVTALNEPSYEERIRALNKIMRLPSSSFKTPTASTAKKLHDIDRKTFKKLSKAISNLSDIEETLAKIATKDPDKQEKYYNRLLKSDEMKDLKKFDRGSYDKIKTEIKDKLAELENPPINVPR